VFESLNQRIQIAADAMEHSRRKAESNAANDWLYGQSCCQAS
jgi:hypothetical protein